MLDVIAQRATLSSVDDDRMLTFDEWCCLNGFSQATGYRLIANGEGPTFVKLSARRKGVSVAENRRWKAAREIKTAA
jgi:predicted DNA-binding transcriptional regulator AlpA